MKILVLDVGGTHVKALATGHRAVRKIESGPTLTPEQMVAAVREATKDWDYDVVSVGFPAPVKNGKIVNEPVNLGPGWIGFDFHHAFDTPTRVINDAAMQALGSYEGGNMLFLGLGTGLGTAMVVDGKVLPMELGHLPYLRGQTFEDHVGKRGLETLGKKRWREVVADVVQRLQAALNADYVVLGGGNSKKLKELPAGARLGDNRNAFTGGYRLWEDKTR
jgi:polyphosphate glucokinase